MNLKKFLYAGLLASSLTTVIFAESITFTSDTPITIKMDGYVIHDMVNSIIQAKTLNINGQKASLPTLLQINKTVTVDLGPLVQRVKLETIEVSLQKVTEEKEFKTDAIFDFTLDPEKGALVFLPRTFEFTKNAVGGFDLNITKQ